MMEVKLGPAVVHPQVDGADRGAGFSPLQRAKADSFRKGEPISAFFH